MPRTPLSPERRALVAEFVPLAAHIAARFATAYGIDRRELVSVAFEAMVEQAPRWDESRGPARKFFGYRVQAALIDHLDAARRSRERLPIEGFVPRLHPDPRGGGESPVVERDEADWMLRKANPCDARFIRLVVLDGMTKVEAARAAGSNENTVHRSIRRGLGRIRSSLAPRETP